MPKKILHVDDERHITALVSRALKRQGFEVVSLNDSREAIERIRTERPDLIILDVEMPYMDGYVVLQSLKADPATNEIPTILLTEKVQDADLFRGWQSGIDCYLTKPVKPNEVTGFAKLIFGMTLNAAEKAAIRL